MKISQIEQRVRPYAALFSVIGALAILVSWVINNTFLNRLEAATKDRNELSRQQEEFERFMELLVVNRNLMKVGTHLEIGLRELAIGRRDSSPNTSSESKSADPVVKGVNS